MLANSRNLKQYFSSAVVVYIRFYAHREEPKQVSSKIACVAISVVICFIFNNRIFTFDKIYDCSGSKI